MFQISFYVPESHLEAVKESIFAAGAGQIGDYAKCAWQTLGEGQFMPLEGSDPFLGEKNKISKEPEYKVELVCRDEIIVNVIAALKKAHPYEEPAYQVVKLAEF